MYIYDDDGRLERLGNSNYSQSQPAYSQIVYKTSNIHNRGLWVPLWTGDGRRREAEKNIGEIRKKNTIINNNLKKLFLISKSFNKNLA